MNIRFYFCNQSIVCAALLTACGGGSNDQSNASQIIADPNPEVAFFNDDASTVYVDSLIGRFVSVFRPLSSISDGILDTDDALAKRTISATETLSETCSSGGSVALDVTTNDVTDEIESASITFSNCVETGQTVNGSISLTANLDDTGDNGTINFNADNFSVTGGEEDISMNGTITVQMQSNADGSTFSISGPSFFLSAAEESISISNYSISAVTDDAAGTSSLSASMTVSSTADGTVTFSIDPPLSINDLDDYPTAGTITMTHADGSSLAINADNGDPATFDFLINSGNSTTTGVQRWDETELAEL